MKPNISGSNEWRTTRFVCAKVPILSNNCLATSSSFTNLVVSPMNPFVTEPPGVVFMKLYCNGGLVAFMASTRKVNMTISLTFLAPNLIKAAIEGRLPWQKTLSRRRREILLPHGMAPQHVRPMRSETRTTLVASIARGRHWLGELITDAAASAETIAKREGCTVDRELRDCAVELETLVTSAVRNRLKSIEPIGDRDLITQVKRVEIRSSQVVIHLTQAFKTNADGKRAPAGSIIQVASWHWNHSAGRLARRVVAAARNAGSSHQLSIRTKSLAEPVSVSGKRDFARQRQSHQNGHSTPIKDSQRPNARAQTRHLGRIG